MSASAESMRLVCAAKVHHDANCRYGGRAIEVHLHPADIERLGWDEGDIVCGLPVVADGKLQPGRMRVYCDVELHGQGAGERTEVRETVLA